MKQLMMLALVALVVMTGCKVKAEFDTDGENSISVEMTSKDDIAPGFGENPYKDDVVAFVDEAVTEIATKGAAAFDEFRKPNSAWFEGDKYVFVWGLDGMRYCYPIDPSGEGINVSDLKDPEGRPIGKMILAAAMSPAGFGWVHYQWINPANEQVEWKSTYVKKAVAPDGKEYLAGCGLYKHEDE